MPSPSPVDDDRERALREIESCCYQAGLVGRLQQACRALAKRYGQDVTLAEIERQTGAELARLTGEYQARMWAEGRVGEAG